MPRRRLLSHGKRQQGNLRKVTYNDQHHSDMTQQSSKVGDITITVEPTPAPVPIHRQLLPPIRFLKSFLDTNYSFRVLALRLSFPGPVLRQESPGALGFWISPLFVELYASCCWEQCSSSSPGNIFLSLGLKFRFGLVW